jgi:hypothetical protein
MSGNNDKTKTKNRKKGAATTPPKPSQPKPGKKAADPTPPEARHLGNQAMIRREKEEDGGAKKSIPLPPFTIPGTGITVYPGPLVEEADMNRLFGFPMPVAHLHARNVDSLEPLSFPGGKKVRFLPNLVLDVTRRKGTIATVDEIDISTGVVTGAPLHKGAPADQLSPTSLRKPMLFYDGHRVHFLADFLPGESYPRYLSERTDVAMRLKSPVLDKLKIDKVGDLLTPNQPMTGRATAFGLVNVEASATPHLDLGRIERAGMPVPTSKKQGKELLHAIKEQLKADLGDGTLALRLIGVTHRLIDEDLSMEEFRTRAFDIIHEKQPLLDPLRIKQIVEDVISEVMHPGFTLEGVVRLGSLRQNVMVGKFSLRAPTTRPLRRAIHGSTFPVSFPYDFSAAGPILLPPGAVADVATIAAGVTAEHAGEKSLFSMTFAGVPAMSSGGGFPFTGRGVAELKMVRRVAGFDLGFRQTIQTNLNKNVLSGNVGDDIRELHRLGKEAEMSNAELTESGKGRQALPSGVLSHPAPASKDAFRVTLLFTLSKTFD